MTIVLGLIFHFIGGFASGSFYLPFKRVRNWSWETYWLVGGFFSWLIVPFVAAWLTVPGFLEIISATDSSTIFWTYFLGLLWGIGGLTFGLAMRYLGLSLGMAVALGFTSSFGSLIPPIYRDLFPGQPGETFSNMLSTSGGIWVLTGVVVCLMGIAVCGRAGMFKERELSQEQKTASIREFNLKKGLIVAVISGILSACFNFGIEAGHEMAAAAETAGANPLFRNNVIFVVVLWGGLSSNLLWCLVLSIRNRSYTDYLNKRSPLLNNYFFAALAGTVWFLQFFFYGMGESKLGNGSSSWILHMAFIILVSSFWGLMLKEWKGVSKRTRNTIVLGILLIIFSVIIVGYGNSIN